MATKKIMDADSRTASILDAGAKIAGKYGAANLTRRMIAVAAKCSEALVTVYLGNNTNARKMIAKHAKKLGITEPTKEKQADIGRKLRAHGPRDKRDTRKRSPREVKAIKEKKMNPVVRETKPSAPAARRESKPAIAREIKRPTAARAPKAPPAAFVPG